MENHLFANFDFCSSPARLRTVCSFANKFNFDKLWGRRIWMLICIGGSGGGGVDGGTSSTHAHIVISTSCIYEDISPRLSRTYGRSASSWVAGWARATQRNIWWNKHTLIQWNLRFRAKLVQWCGGGFLCSDKYPNFLIIRALPKHAAPKGSMASQGEALG